MGEVLEANDTIVTVVVPETRAVGSVDVTIESDTGATVRLDNGFAFLEMGIITHISPDRGQFGTFVEIYGTNLLGGGDTIQRVVFAGTNAYDIQHVSNTRIRVRAGASFETGVGNLRIIANTFGETVAENIWTYDVPSNITDICT